MTEIDFDAVVDWADGFRQRHLGDVRREQWWDAFQNVPAERFAGAVAAVVLAHRPFTSYRVAHALREAEPLPVADLPARPAPQRDDWREDWKEERTEPGTA